jgi:NAD(P)-dependent dehydrogenase (short-subunit alcohol dehydrogenase family)
MSHGTFEKSRVLLTGASSGIGAELARQLAVEKARVVLAARRVEKLEAVAAECKAVGGEPHPIAADVSSEKGCRDLVERTVAALGGIDVLLLNAGISHYERVEDVKDLAVYTRMLETNYLGPVYLTHFALPHVKASRGRIAVVSSLQGKVGMPRCAAYAASKHAVHGFFDALP